MRAAWAIAGKDLRLLVRDRMALFWALVFPILFALFFGSVMAGDDGPRGRIDVVVVAGAGAEAEPGASILTRLGANPALALAHRPRAEAEAAVAAGRAAAWIEVPAGYGVDPGAALALAVDPSRTAEGAVVRAALAQAVAPAVTAPWREQAVVRAGRPRPRSTELVFPAALLWGLMGCAATFAVAMVAERAGGTDLRLRAAPIGPATVLAGKALAAAAASAADLVLLLVLGWAVLSVRIPALLPLLVAALAVTVAFVGISLLLSTLGRTVQGVAGAGWSTLLVLAMAGGAMVPVAFMPAWMQGVAAASPVSWAIRVLEGATWRQQPLAALAGPCLVLLAIGLGTFTLAAWRLAKERR